MSINVVSKKNVLLLLLSLVLVLGLFSTSSRVLAIGSPNLALNLHPSSQEFPKLAASYTCCADNVLYTVDGLISYGHEPGNRWTSWGSWNETDWLSIDFGTPKSFNQVKLYVYDDGGGVQPPVSYEIQYWDAKSNNWKNIETQIKTPINPAAALNTVNFDRITVQKLRIEFTNYTYSGLVELEVFNIESLTRTIAEANGIYEAAVVGTTAGQYSSEAKAALAAAIELAQEVAGNSEADEITKDAAVNSLNSAINDFKASVNILKSYYSAFSNVNHDVITLYVSNLLDNCLFA